MPIRTIGEIKDGTDYSDAILPRTELEAQTWYDADGERVTLYQTIEEAVNAAARSTMAYVMLIVDEGDGTYSISFQYDEFA